MARDNGGIIGPVNDPTSTTASGVWSLEEQYQAQLAGNWPSAPAPFSINSLRFEESNTDYLSRTPASSGSQRIFTFSTWVKKCDFSSGVLLSSGESDGDPNFAIYFDSSSRLNILFYSGASTVLQYITNAVYRDVSAWYHIVVAVDTTQATASNRVRLYVNGTEETSFSTETDPSQNTDISINTASYRSAIAAGVDNGDRFSGYMSEVVLIDGQQLDATSFGVSDANGVWTPIRYEGTFGTNGFQLQFGNAAALGTDSSINENNFTVNNLTSIDQTTDYPVNNFATLNSLIRNATGSTLTLSNGNLQGYSASTSFFGGFSSTLGVSSGKYYWEYKLVSTTAGLFYTGIGVTSENYLNYISAASRGDPMAGGTSSSKAESYEYLVYNGKKQHDGTATDHGDTMTTGDIAMVALDLDNNYIYFGKNGTWQNSSDPTSGSSGTGAAFSLDTGLSYFPIVDQYHTNTTAINFGNPPFTISSGNSDANGYGNFEYAVPSGYYALCTKNLAEYG